MSKVEVSREWLQTVRKILTRCYGESCRAIGCAMSTHSSNYQDISCEYHGRIEKVVEEIDDLLGEKP